MNYSAEITQLMKKFYLSLSEKDRRRYAAIEASKLGHGGVTYISKVFGCSRDTVRSGLKQLEQLSVEELGQDYIRKQGAGRKRLIQTLDGLENSFKSIVETHKSSNSQRIGLSHRKLVKLLEESGYKVSITVVRQLIKEYESEH